MYTIDLCALTVHEVARRDFDPAAAEYFRARIAAGARRRLGLHVRLEGLDAGGGLANVGDGAVLQIEHLFAIAGDVVHVVRDQDEGDAFPPHLPEAVEALRLEAHVAHGQHFVQQEHVGIQRRRHGETQPHRHAGTVVLHRRLHEIADFREVDDLVDLGVGFALGEPQHRRIHVDVFPAGQDGIEARPQRDERPHPPPHFDAAGIGLDQAVEHFQQRGFPRPVVPDQPQAFAALQLESHVVDGPEFLRAQAGRRKT